MKITLDVLDNIELNNQIKKLKLILKAADITVETRSSKIEHE